MSIENTNYDLEREQRRARMKEEKRRQARKRALIKKFAPIVAVVVILAIVLIVSIVIGIKALVKSLDKNHKKDDVSIEEMSTVTSNGIEIFVRSLDQLPPKDIEITGFEDMTDVSITVKPGYDLDDSNATSAVSEEDVQSQYAALINVSTGEVIVSKNGKDRMYPASMTKVMTVLVAAEHITNLDDPFTITREDTDFAYRNDLSPAGFLDGETIPVRDILYGAILPSGGECCHALERYVADSEEDFIQMMNDKAASLGLVDTHFTNSAGLYNDNHYTTAYEMSMIMKAAIENDVCRQILYEHIYKTSPTEQHPDGLELSNWFLRRIEDKYDKTVVMGAKTGYVPQSGNCATSYTIDSAGQIFICTTGNAHSAWRAIFDHKNLYDAYIN